MKISAVTQQINQVITIGFNLNTVLLSQCHQSLHCKRINKQTAIDEFGEVYLFSCLSQVILVIREDLRGYNNVKLQPTAS